MRKKFCCNQLTKIILQEEIIKYDETVRNYDLQCKEKVYALYFCPWCGEEFGKELNSEYFDILEEEYGIDDPDFINFTNVPEEFKTDEWWRKRGL